MKHLFRPLAALLLMLLVFSVGGGPGCQDHNAAFSDEGLLVASAGQLRTSVVTPYLAAPIERGTNVLWCGTFQLAWNEVANLAGGELQFRGETPEAAKQLNRRLFTSADLDAGSYVALAGFVRDGIYGRIRAELFGKFGGAASPKSLPDPRIASRPQDIVAYAYLFKNLEFAEKFERADSPLVFDGVSVGCFGMGEEYKPGRDKIARQIVIRDYLSEDDFIIELKTKSPEDRFILAKVASGGTLAETVAAVQRRVASAKPSSADEADVLVVPKVNFDITRSFTEVTGLRLIPTKAGMADDLTVLEAEQNTRFQMDEKGVRLRSEAHISIGCSAPYRPQPEHRMIFDKPFLIMLSRGDAKTPYFALWVANAELLVRAKQ